MAGLLGGKKEGHGRACWRMCVASVKVPRDKSSTSSAGEEKKASLSKEEVRKIVRNVLLDI